jgi:hypothetical protein
MAGTRVLHPGTVRYPGIRIQTSLCSASRPYGFPLRRSVLWYTLAKPLASGDGPTLVGSDNLAAYIRPSGEAFPAAVQSPARVCGGTVPKADSEGSPE